MYIHTSHSTDRDVYLNITVLFVILHTDEEYTVPSQLTQSRAAPSPSSTHSEEVTDLSGTGKGSEGRGELLSPDHGGEYVGGTVEPLNKGLSE